MAPSVASFADLLRSAVSDPGILSTAYRQFHNYSLGNQLLALSQCLGRRIQRGPMATYPRWRELGRQVRKGEKAITLCMPVTIKRTRDEAADPDGVDTFTRFVYKPNWFVLAQTDGEPVPEQPIPAWDADRALATLEVQGSRLTPQTATVWDSRASGRSPSTRSTPYRTRPASMNWPMCAATPPNAKRRAVNG
ncbi:MAG: hypothetical protein DMF90_21340 [Acidobacteria bacterium]|nr:MAG: hypothetical protein DMF90_21340 [Acidobacteriota bacterium]